jgi:hypothetical protein
MRGSRRLWLSFALCLAATLFAIPIAISRDHSLAAGAATSPSSPGVTTPSGWTAFVPDDQAFRVIGPADAKTAVMSTSLGPAKKATFDDGAYSITWLALPTGLDDQQALEQGEVGLLRPLVGRLADEESSLDDEGAPGFGLLITIEQTTYAVRLFASGGMLFQVVGSAPAGSAQVSDATAFVDSFDLAEADVGPPA